MYDTVVMTKGGAFMDMALPYLSNIKEHQKENQYYVNGTIANGQQLWIFEDKIQFKGSIAKYHLKDNIQTLDRSATQRAIESLSDCLKLDFRTADVTRADVGLTIDTDYKPETYYPLFGTSNQYTRSLYKNSLYYRVTNREKSFYDKVKDARAKGMFIPDFIAGRNLTRFEVRYKKKILDQLNRNSLKAADLYDEQFYKMMLDKWFTEYQNIKKMSCMQIDKNKIERPSDLANQVMANLLYSSGIDILSGIEELMKQAKQINVFEGGNPSRDYSRAKKHLNNVLQSGRESELVKEIDQKFKDSIAFYR